MNCKIKQLGLPDIEREKEFLVSDRKLVSGDVNMDGKSLLLVVTFSEGAIVISES